MTHINKITRPGALLLSFFVFLLIGTSFSVYGSGTQLQTKSDIGQIVELGSYTSHSGIYIYTNQHFIDLGFDGSGTAEDPYRIEYLNITTDSMRAIYVRDTTVHFVIQHCLLAGDWYGIEIEKIAGGNITIYNNTITNFPGEELVVGIDLENTENVTMHKNYCNSDTYGTKITSCPNIEVTENTFRGDKNSGIYVENTEKATIANNTFFDSNWGVWLVNCPFSTIYNNTCTSPDYESIRTEQSENVTIALNTLIDIKKGGFSYGMYINKGHNTTITNNTILTHEYGIWLVETKFTIIKNNLIQDQRKYGVMLGGEYEEEFLAANNVVHHNTFSNNNGNSNQATDYGENNIWYEQGIQEGNYWSDYLGTGSYSIGGPAGSVDLYPLLTPVVPPLIPEIRKYLPMIILISPLVPLLALVTHRKKKGTE